MCSLALVELAHRTEEQDTLWKDKGKLCALPEACAGDKIQYLTPSYRNFLNARACISAAYLLPMAPDDDDDEDDRVFCEI